MDTTPRLGDSDNNLLFKIAQALEDGAVSGITQAAADARYVQKAGDTMTGALNVGVDVTDAANLAIDPDASAPVILTRHVADAAPAILRIQKKGTGTGVDGAVRVNDNLGRVDFYGWDGAAFAAGSVFQLTANENWVAGTNRGGRLSVNVVPNAGIATVEVARFTGSAVDLRNSAALQISGVDYHNPLSVYAAGTVYTLTAASAAVDFGTTDPALTINAVGTYAIRARVKVALNGATFAANRTLTLKLRRTNNTAADVSNSSTTWVVPITTTITNTLAVIDLPEVLYTTANANDALALFADISVVPTAGTISIDEASIVAVRLS
jgi:hypothetical protein